MAISIPCRHCVKEAIYMSGPAVLLVIHGIVKRAQQERTGWCGPIPQDCKYTFLDAAMLSIACYPIVFSLCYSPWLRFIPWKTAPFVTHDNHYHFFPLTVAMWNAGIFGDISRMCWRKVRGYFTRAWRLSLFPMPATFSADFWKLRLEHQIPRLSGRGP